MDTQQIDMDFDMHQDNFGNTGNCTEIRNIGNEFEQCKLKFH